MEHSRKADKALAPVLKTTKRYKGARENDKLNKIQFVIYQQAKQVSIHVFPIATHIATQFQAI